jgi:hypothetical protein
LRDFGAEDVFARVMATSVRPVTRSQVSPSRTWRRAGLVVVAALLVAASVTAQALDLTPVAIVLVVIAAVVLAPLALPSVDV